MDIVDRDLEKAEEDASSAVHEESKRRPGSHEGIQRRSMRSSASSSSSSSVSVVREEMNLSRVNTQLDLERHPTALSRIETHRSQHSATVGRTQTSRESRKPLPRFGGGKEYPPLLPDREEYVVEFDGPDDPLHPQNWPMKKK